MSEEDKFRISIMAVKPTGDVDPTTDGEIEVEETISHADGIGLTAMFRSKAWSDWQDLLLKKLQSDTRNLMINPKMEDKAALKVSGAWMAYESTNGMASAVIEQTEAISAELAKKSDSQK